VPSAPKGRWTPSLRNSFPIPCAAPRWPGSQPRHVGKILRGGFVRTPNATTAAREDRPPGLGNRIRGLGDRRKRPWEFVRSDGRRGVGRRGTEGGRPRRELLRYRGRLRMGAQRGGPRQG